MDGPLCGVGLTLHHGGCKAERKAESREQLHLGLVGLRAQRRIQTILILGCVFIHRQVLFPIEQEAEHPRAVRET